MDNITRQQRLLAIYDSSFLDVIGFLLCTLFVGAVILLGLYAAI
jgi:hypothetical protein